MTETGTTSTEHPLLPALRRAIADRDLARALGTRDDAAILHRVEFDDPAEDAAALDRRRHLDEAMVRQLGPATAVIQALYPQSACRRAAIMLRETRDEIQVTLALATWLRLHTEAAAS